MDIRATASFQSIANAWLRHAEHMSIAVSIRSTHSREVVEDNRADANENCETTQPTAFDARSKRLLLPSPSMAVERLEGRLASISPAASCVLNLFKANHIKGRILLDSRPNLPSAKPGRTHEARRSDRSLTKKPKLVREVRTFFFLYSRA